VYIQKINHPKEKIKGFFLVYLGDASTGGSHWTCFSTNDKNIFYYVNFGMPPPKEVDKYIKTTTGKKRYTINKIQSQAVQATYCGWFSIVSLYCISNTKGSVSKRMKDFNNWLNDSDLNNNNYRLLNFFLDAKR
jgi:hypothetical protein